MNIHVRKITTQMPKVARYIQVTMKLLVAARKKSGITREQRTEISGAIDMMNSHFNEILRDIKTIAGYGEPDPTVVKSKYDY